MNCAHLLVQNAVVVGYQNVLERANMAVLMAQRLKPGAQGIASWCPGLILCNLTLYIYSPPRFIVKVLVHIAWQ